MTKEEIETTFANQPYWAYKQGLQDGTAYTWASFRREAAKDILVAAIKADDEREVIFEDKNFPCYVRQSIKLADELIKQLREEQK